MWPYWMLFGLFAVGALLTAPDFRRSKPIGVPLLFGALVIVIFVGLRYDTGTDWANYLRHWREAENVSLDRLISLHGDPGFYTLMWLLRRVDAGFWVVNLICAAIFTWGLLAFVKRLPNPWLAIAVAVPYLIIVIAMSGTRQATALGFIFLALVAFTRRNTRAFLGWSAAATLFHASAILTVPFAGLSFTRNRFQALLLGLAIVFLAWFTLGSPLALYSRRYLTEGLPSAGLIYRVGMTSVAALLYFIAVQRRVGLEQHERTLWRNYSLFAFAAIGIAVAFPTSTALDRILIYLFPLQIFVLSMFPYVAQRRGTPTLPIAAILFYLAAILFVFLNFGVNAESYIPYQIYWLSSGSA